MRWKFLVLLFGVVFLWTQMGFAQDPECPDCPPGREDAVQLPDVLIKAFHGDAVTITPTRIVVDVNKFEKAGSVERIEDILTHLTGIDVMRSSCSADPQTVVLMRGFDDSRFTVALNGRPITAPTAGADTFVDWSSLTTGDIEKIEIIRGAASPLYENSQGGIINIITKKGERVKTLRPTVTLQSGYSSFDTYTGRLTAGGGVGDLGYFLNFGYKESDGYLRNNYWRGMDYSARLDYRFPAEGTIVLSYKSSDLDMGFPVVNDPALASYDPSYPIVLQDADTLRKFRAISYPGGKAYREKHSSHLDLVYEQPFEQTALKMQVYQTTGGEDNYSYEYDTAKKALVQKFSGGDDRHETQYGGILQYRLDMWENNSLTVGYDYREMEVKTKHDLWRIQAGYFQDIWSVTPKLTFDFGLRYAHARELTYEYADPGTTTRYRHKIKTELWLPKSTLSYRFTPSTEAFVSVNRDYHVPAC